MPSPCPPIAILGTAKSLHSLGRSLYLDSQDPLLTDMDPRLPMYSRFNRSWQGLTKLR